jgi:hypothetical protein
MDGTLASSKLSTHPSSPNPSLRPSGSLSELASLQRGLSPSDSISRLLSPSSLFGSGLSPAAPVTASASCYPRPRQYRPGGGLSPS